MPISKKPSKLTRTYDFKGKKDAYTKPMPSASRPATTAKRPRASRKY